MRKQPIGETPGAKPPPPPAGPQFPRMPLVSVSWAGGTGMYAVDSSGRLWFTAHAHTDQPDWRRIMGPLLSEAGPL